MTRLSLGRRAALAALLSTAATHALADAHTGPVVVYSPHGEDIMQMVSDAFTEETGIEVEFLTAGGGELVDRVRAESANPVADVLYGNPSSVFMELADEGLLAEFVPAWAADLDPYFVSEDGTWHGTIQTPVVLFYNSEMLSAEEAPTDWFDLADDAYADEIIIRSTTSAASRATHAALAYQFHRDGTLETEGWDFFRDWDANIRRYVYNSGLMFQAIGRQEGAIGFWTLSGVTDNVENNNLPLEIVNAESGSLVITDGIGIIAGGPNTSAAEQFVEFAGSEEVQVMLAQEFNRMPTLPAALEQAPAWMQSFEITPMDVDWSVLAEFQSEWIRTIEDEIRDSDKVEVQQ